MIRQFRILIPALLLTLLLGGCGTAPDPGAAVAAPASAGVVSPSPAASASVDAPIVISELMAKNRATLADGSGGFPDWIELYQSGSEPAELEGWSLSDRETGEGWRFPAYTLAPGQHLLVFAGSDAVPTEGALCASFGLSGGETLYLRRPDGSCAAAVPVTEPEADVSQILREDGSYTACLWPTPGMPNSREGYLSSLAGRETGDGLCINEVLVHNDRYLSDVQAGYCDLVELKNRSEGEIRLADYSLCDKSGKAPAPLPDKTLAPGELFLVYCSGNSAFTSTAAFHTDFALDAQSECLFLRHSDGALADYTALHGIPDGGSFGRLPDEDGFFYFAQPTPGAENADGRRFLSSVPAAGTAPGVYEGVDSLTLTLSAEALFDGEEAPRIRYTTDGSMPDENSDLYTGPIEIDRSCVLRAVAAEEDALPGRAGTFGYFLNEDLHLPVLSIAVNDVSRFRTLYFNSVKGEELPGNLSLYDGEHSFSKDGALSLKGFTSLRLPKKSLGFAFPDRIDGPLEADVFGNGVTRFAHLSIRAGQDSLRTLFRTELMQDLVLESSEHLLVQSSKYCVVFVNGEYWGLYALKEDLDRSYYAGHFGVSKDSVTNLKGEVPHASPFYQEVLLYAEEHELSDPACYAELSRRMDVDSFIDWILFEGYSGNTDTLNNVRFYRSDEDDGRWRWALFDLDWAFYNTRNSYYVIMNLECNSGYQMYALMWKLFENPDFKSAFLRRAGELYRTTLSNEHVLAAVDRWAALLEPEIARDEKLRQNDYQSWTYHVGVLRQFLIENEYDALSVRHLAELLHMSEEEMAAAMNR